MNWKLTDADFSSDPLICSSAVLLLSSVPMTTSWKAKGHFVQAKADKYKHARHDCSQFCDATPSGLWLCRVTQNSMKTLTTVSGGSSGTTRCKIGMLHDQQLASCCGYHGNSLKKRPVPVVCCVGESPESPPALRVHLQKRCREDQIEDSSESVAFKSLLRNLHVMNHIRKVAAVTLQCL